MAAHFGKHAILRKSCDSTRMFKICTILDNLDIMESGLTQKEKPKESEQESQSKSSDLLEFVEALGEDYENQGYSF